jgi:hypothetical protein
MAIHHHAHNRYAFRFDESLALFGKIVSESHAVCRYLCSHTQGSIASVRILQPIRAEMPLILP